MPRRKFANQKALIDYAEHNGLVYLWEDAKRRPSLPAFTKRQQLLSPDQYEIVDVRTSRGVRQALLFPKAILQAEFEANREVLAMKRERRRAKRAATFVFIAGRYAALRALHRSMLKRVSLGPVRN